MYAVSENNFEAFTDKYVALVTKQHGNKYHFNFSYLKSRFILPSFRRLGSRYFNVCREYYYLNGDNIPSYNKSDIEIEDDKDLVILEKEIVSPLFWKVKYLTSKEIKEEYNFNLTEKNLINNRLYYLRIDSK